MRKLFMTLIILVAFAFSASAQVPSSPFSFYAGGLVSIPQSDGFSQLFKSGWHGMAGVNYSIAPKFQLSGKVEYHTFGMDFGSISGFSGGNFNALMFGVDGRFNLNLPAAPVAPYFIVGSGIASVKFNDVTGSSLATSIFSVYNAALPGSQSEIYWNIGAGFEMKMGPAMNLFVQARYVNIGSGDGNINFIPISVGLKFL